MNRRRYALGTALSFLGACPAYASRIADPFKKKLTEGYDALLVIGTALSGCAFLAVLIQCILCVSQGKQAPWGRLGVIGAVTVAIMAMPLIKSFFGIR